MSWWSRMLNQSRSDEVSRDIDREIRFHLDERADDLIEHGMRPGDARREARRRFGNLAMQAENTRERDMFGWVDTLLRDLRYAIRSLRSAPAFAAVAVLSLALGIGANTAIFSIIDSLMLKSLPVQHPEELVLVLRSGSDVLTNPLWEAIRDRQDIFTGAFAFAGTTFDLAEGGVAHRIRADLVSGGYFTTLGVQAEVGRPLVESDDHRGCPAVAVLSDQFWRSQYAGDPAVIGKTISFNGHPFQIAGVIEPRFFGMSVGDRPQAFVPLCAQAIIHGSAKYLDLRSHWYLEVVGRPKAGLTTAQIDARLESLAPGIIESTIPADFPPEDVAEYRKATFTASPGGRGVSDLRNTYKKALYIVMVIVGLVLAVACANVANLLLARAAVRQREMAIRLALGASRWRLARQLIAESLLLSIVSAALGALVAVWGSKLLVGLLSQPGGRNVLLDLSPDRTVLAFTTTVAVATGLLFGLVPAWRAGRVDPQSAMKAQGRGVMEGHTRFGTAKTLVVAQVAISLVLIAAAGLLISSWRALAAVDPGFRRNGILIVSADIHETQTPPEQRAPYFQQLLERMRAIPGVTDASVSSLTPVGGASWNNLIKVDGINAKSHDVLPWMNAVSSGYFATLDIPIEQGRDFKDTDDASAPKVAIVSEAMARHFYGTPAAIGRTFEIQHGKDWTSPIEIIGVVRDTKYVSLRDTIKPIIYLPVLQEETTAEYQAFELRATVPPASVLPAVRGAFTEQSSRIVLDVTTMDRQLTNSMTLSRAIAMLSGFFGGLALLLATIGLYGIMTYNVARRRNEIGVRIALGAERSRVIGMVLGEVGRIVVAGVVVGVLATVVAMRLVKGFLFGLGPNDPSTLMISAAILLGVGLCAALIPARRAAGLDPVAALREE